MVKFSKELEAQLIPEWKEAFVNYWQLKKQVKKIKISRKPHVHDGNSSSIHDFGRSIFDSIRSFTMSASHKLHKSHEVSQVCFFFLFLLSCKYSFWGWYICVEGFPETDSLSLRENGKVCVYFSLRKPSRGISLGGLCFVLLFEQRKGRVMLL